MSRIVSVLPVADDDYTVSIEDRRDGREHVMSTPDELGIWLKSFKQGHCIQPSRGFCDCCGELHSERDIDGDISEFCRSTRPR